MRHARSTIIIGLTVLGLSACGSSAVQGGANGAGGLTTKPPTTTAPPAATGGGAAAGGAASATIAGYAFQIAGSPTAGTALTVTNSDSVTHTFTSADGGVDVKVPAGGSAQVTFAKAGTFTVVCKIHASMKASVTVA